MDRSSGTTMCVGLLAVLIFVTGVSESYAKTSASLKYTTDREENLNEGKETLVLPYAFPSDSMGTTFGVGALAKGYGQEQLLIAGSVWGSADDAVGGVLALLNFLPQRGFSSPYWGRLATILVSALIPIRSQRVTTVPRGQMTRMNMTTWKPAEWITGGR